MTRFLRILVSFAYSVMLLLTVLLLASSPVNAQIYVTSDTTIDSDVSGQDVYVGKNSTDFTTLPGTITLTVTDPAKIGGFDSVGNITNWLSIYGMHRADINTTQLLSGVKCFDNSIVNLGNELSNENSAQVGEIDAADHSTVNLYSAYISFEPLGGFPVGGISASGDATINFFGALSGAFGLGASGNTTINIYQGDFTGIEHQDTSIVNFFGGATGHLWCNGNSITNITGGIVGDIECATNSTVNISGGGIVSNQYGPAISVGGKSVLHFSGSSLSFSSADGSGNDYTVSGFLADGQPINIDLADYSMKGHFVGGGNSLTFLAGVAAIAPEPASLALLMIPLLAVAPRLRQKRESLRKGSPRAPSFLS